jgi:hypothetical protein
MNETIAQWANSKARTLRLWGKIPSVMEGWVIDLLNEHPDINPQDAWAALHKVAREATV